MKITFFLRCFAVGTLAVVLSPLISRGENLFSGNLLASRSVSGSGISPSVPPLADRITEIRLYGVSDGEPVQKIIGREEIRNGGPFGFSGYTSGIVVFCEEEMTVSVDGQQFPKILKKRNGGFAAKYFGDLLSHMIPSSMRDNAYFEGPRSDSRQEKTINFLRGGYSYFPKVTGNAIVQEDQLRIAFEKGKDHFEVVVQQEGFQSRPLPMGDEGDFSPFHYVGTRLERLKNAIPDFDQRLAAIRRGIDRVERRLGGPDLVSRVILLDYNGIENALSCEDSNDIWFYIQTFRQESIEELETISAHEALHKFVDRKKLVRSSLVRKRFADLKGYDSLSNERFLMVTRGIVPRNSGPVQPENQLFFEFINERHFLKERKGGHSGDNPDEFCTSFLHSLFFADRLEGNLNRPIRLGNGSTRRLDASEKQRILKAYIETWNMFQEILRLENSDSLPWVSTATYGKGGVEVSEGS